MSELEKNYDAEDIDILQGVKAVRRRPGMYIGDTDNNGLHHLIYEITDNAVDEALAGYCDEIIIEKNEDGSVTITDNGRGIPVKEHPIHKVSAATIIFTELHAGGKFRKGSYKVSGGLHGVGSTVTNALSEYLELRIKRDGAEYYQRFEEGVPVSDLKEIRKLKDGERTGTSVRFKPDETKFPEAKEESGVVEFSLDFIRDRIERTSYLTPKLKFVIKDGEKEEVFYSENGIVDYVEKISPTLYKTLPKFNEEDGEEMLAFKPKYFHGEGEYENEYDKSIFTAEVEIAFTYQNKYFGSNVTSFVNNIHTAQGGKHVVGFENALLKSLNDYNIKVLKGEEVFDKQDILEGMNAVISFKTEEPKFSDQTKQKLSTGAAQKLCYKVTKDYLESVFETDPDLTEFLVNKAKSAKKMREQIDKKREEVQKNANVVVSGGKPKKLTDCDIKTREGTELFLVEGDSAGGAAKQARDRKFQAIMPLKGKILNAIKSENEKVENSEEVKNLRLALKTGTDEDFDLEKLRYEKIIIMCDADVDGAHIETLLLTYFMHKMPQILENGNIYLAQPPLYVLKSKNGGAKVKSIYVQDDEELEKLYPDGIPSNLSKQRFKGLGEMNPDQLWETTMNPETRTLIKVVLSEEKKEDTIKVFEDLMGKKVEPRRDYIFKNAINFELN